MRYDPYEMSTPAGLTLTLVLINLGAVCLMTWFANHAGPGIKQQTSYEVPVETTTIFYDLLSTKWEEQPPITLQGNCYCKHDFMLASGGFECNGAIVKKLSVYRCTKSVKTFEISADNFK